MCRGIVGRVGAVLFCVVCCITVSAAQQESAPSDNQQQDPTAKSTGPRGRFGNQFLGMVPLLQIDSVRRELQVDEEQATQIESFTVQIHEDFAEEIRFLLRSWRQGRVGERGQLREKVAAIADRINKRLDEVLHEDQLNRLRQIDLQLDLQRQGAAERLTSSDLAAALDLTDEQQQQLRKQAESHRSSNEESPRTLAQTRMEVSKILTTQQLEKLENLLGPEFDLSAAMLDRPPRRGRPARRGDWRRPLRRRAAPAADSEETESI